MEMATIEVENVSTCAVFTFRFEELNRKVNCESKRNEKRAEEFSSESVIMNTKYYVAKTFKGVGEFRAAQSSAYGNFPIAT